MANVDFHIRSNPFPYTSTILLLHFQKPICHFYRASISISNHRFLLLSCPRKHVCLSQRWDSNAESYDNKNFLFDRNDGREVVADDFDDNMDQWSEVLEEYIDSIWILKVFGSFGWMLPPIILSMLLASGLKAFLMALALPLGQSTLTFAFQRMQNRGKNKQKHNINNNTKKGRSRARASRKVKLEDATQWAGSQTTTKRKKEYQSWVLRRDISANNSENSGSNFGGWDDLETGRQSKTGSSRSSTHKSGGSHTTPAEKGKLSWSMRESETDAPLLLRSLVAIFPFFNSWTKTL